MKLILMRHCTASWGSQIGDHDRPLDKTGLAEAQGLGDWLRAHDHLPSHAVVSDSLRTRQTFEGLNLTCGVSFSRQLYLAPPSDLVAAVQGHEGDILIIAHNPGIAEFAHAVAKSPPGPAVFWTYPSGSTLVLDRNTADVIDFTTPQHLGERD